MDSRLQHSLHQNGPLILIVLFAILDMLITWQILTYSLTTKFVIPQNGMVYGYYLYFDTGLLKAGLMAKSLLLYLIAFLIGRRWPTRPPEGPAA